MNPAAITEVLELHVQGFPAETVSFGSTVTILCANPISAARWREHAPNGVLPESGVPVVVELVAMYDEVPC